MLNTQFHLWNVARITSCIGVTSYLLSVLGGNVVWREALCNHHQAFYVRFNAHSDWSYECSPKRVNDLGRGNEAAFPFRGVYSSDHAAPTAAMKCYTAQSANHLVTNLHAHGWMLNRSDFSSARKHVYSYEYVIKNALLNFELSYIKVR
jgi:hypothetical protein